jgi:membrane-associated phospholipid phosphatase
MHSLIRSVVVAAALTYGATLGAQNVGSAADSVQRAAPAEANATTNGVPWMTKRDGEAAAGGLVATVAIAPFDRRISRTLSGRPHRARSVHHTANDVAFFGGSGPFVLSGLVYAAGTEGRVHSVATGALHNMEAIALASAITGVAKGFTGRALPGVQSRHSFSFGRGFHDGNGPFVSFPSGHTAAAFAMAATLGPELGRANARLGDVVEPIAFTGAAAVGVARVIQHVHWPSDLPMAVVIGTWSGRAVQAHAYRRGRVASAIRGMTVAPESHGRTAIGWSSLLSDLPSR